MNRVFIAALFVLAACSSDTSLEKACRFEAPCVIVNGVAVVEGDLGWEPRGTEEGQCSQGSIACPGGSTEVCEGFIGSEDEVCDYVDNDCDGLTDENGLLWMGAPCSNNEGVIAPPVETVGACRNGVISCDSLEWVCADDVKPTDEICDGQDNDCDGVKDNYTVDNPGTVCSTIECLPEEPICISGEYICANENDLGEEVCDGFDNDCDGEVDEDIQVDIIYDAEPTTLNIGPCRAGVYECVNGEYLLSGMVIPTQEQCNNIDDDCDGEVDESSDGSPIITYAGYTGPPETEDVGICEGARFICIDGDDSFIHETLPRVEVCDNGLDDDCDGVVDEEDGSVAAQAFYLVIDLSGSMNDYLLPVRDAICSWADSDIMEHSRFALGYAGLGFSSTHPYTLVALDFTTADEVCHFMSQPGWGAPAGGGSEYLINLVLESHSLSWPSGLNKQVITFSDENPYSSPSMTNIDMLTTVEESCTDNNYQLTVFQNPTGGPWGTLAAFCEGKTFNLSEDFQQMLDSLNAAFTGCP